MRIIAGALGGRVFHIPRGLNARPTTDRVRESLFSILRDRIRDARVLDLFAGSGALGMEALSRGAGFALFCDSDNRAVRAIKNTLTDFRIDSGRYAVLHTDFRQALDRFRREGKSFDVVFLDPPYESGFYEKALASLADGLLADGGIVVMERALRLDMPSLPPSMAIADERRYGDIRLTFIQKEENS